MNKVYNIDCIEGIKKINSNMIDCIITDPPYCIGTTSNGLTASWHDNNLVIPFFKELFKEWNRVLKNGSSIYINTDWRTYPFLYPLLYNYFTIKNCIVWDYEWIKAGSHYRFSHEFIIFAIKGEQKRKFSASERDVWRIKPINFTNKNPELHPTTKPNELIRKMIYEGTSKGDLILDTFIGSGTTGIIAKQEGRNFIGFEIDESMYKVASKRIGDTKYFRKLNVFDEYKNKGHQQGKK